MTLLLSIAALLLGPLIYAAGRHNPTMRRIFDVSIIAAIAVIVFVHILPEAYARVGPPMVAVFFAGVAFPLLLERLFRRAADTAHLVIVVIAAIGLLLHATIDGLALLPGSNTSLAHAIVLHRIPVGMAIWWAVRPTLGTAVAVAIFASIILATTAGYIVGDTIFELAETDGMAVLQAFISGSLIHVVFFGVKHKHE